MKSLLGKPTGLRSVAAFWQNDKPNGMGVTIRTSDEFVVEFMDMMSNALEICDRGWQGEADKQAVALVLLEQLRELATRKDALTEEETWRVIENVYLLERHGFIPNDEFNGVVFAYVYGRVGNPTASDGQHKTCAIPPRGVSNVKPH